MGAEQMILQEQQAEEQKRYNDMTKIKARESQNIEYKSNWHDKYLEWICALSCNMESQLNENKNVIKI